eukprot:1156841-Pelagomonas_calceolata.AAC.1
MGHPYNQQADVLGLAKWDKGYKGVKTFRWDWHGHGTTKSKEDWLNKPGEHQLLAPAETDPFKSTPGLPWCCPSGFSQYQIMLGPLLLKLNLVSSTWHLLLVGRQGNVPAEVGE